VVGKIILKKFISTGTAVQWLIAASFLNYRAFLVTRLGNPYKNLPPEALLRSR